VRGEQELGYKLLEYKVVARRGNFFGLTSRARGRLIDG
jgi:hypothetical protein